MRPSTSATSSRVVQPQRSRPFPRCLTLVLRELIHYTVLRLYQRYNQDNDTCLAYPFTCDRSFTMGMFQILAVAVLLAVQPGAGEKQFVEWWRNYDEQIMMNNSWEEGYHFRMKNELPFESLPEFSETLEPPAGVGPDFGKKLVLYAQKNFTLLLVTPKETLDGMSVLDDRYKQALKQCEGDRSWIVALPANTWTEVALNPYCSMGYRTDEIRIDLYWTSFSSRPLVDIVTNSLTCTPHELFGWDGTNRAYRPLAQKCSGSKTFEGYPDAGSRLQQVF